MKKLAFIAHIAPTHDALEVIGHTFYCLYSSYPRDPANQKIVKIVLKVFKKKLYKNVKLLMNDTQCTTTDEDECQLTQVT